MLTYNFVRSTVEHVEQDNDQKETDEKSKSKQHIEVCNKTDIVYMVSLKDYSLLITFVLLKIF